MKLSKKKQILLINTPDDDLEDVFPQYGLEELLEYKQRLLDIDAHIESVQNTNYQKLLEKRINKMEDKLVLQQQVVEIALDISTIKKIYKIRKSKKKKISASIVIMLSDWHYDSLIYPERINFLNKTTPKIMDKRINKCYSNTMRLCHMALVDVDIDRIIIHLGGDFITGNIHTENAENTAMRPMEAIKVVFDRIAAGVEMFANEFGEKLLVICNFGNHARISSRIHFSSEAHNSMEWLAYHQLQKMYPQVKMMIGDSPYDYLDIYGKTIRWTHGQHIAQYRGGVGGLYPALKRNLPRLDQGRFADLTCMGHWHQYIRDTNWLCNGSLIGYDNYAMAKGFPYSPPVQRFFLFLSNGMVAGEYPILVE